MARPTVRFGCPVCGQHIVVNADGHLRKHLTWIAAHAAEFGFPPDDSVCKASGLKVDSRGGRGRCMDCGQGTLGEDYMVHRSLWTKYVGDRAQGFLCIGCLEARMGRELWSGDFIHWPINNVDEHPRTDRLRDRLTREVQGEQAHDGEGEGAGQG